MASSSGFEALDRATIRIAKRFKYLPGRINDVASAMWVPQQVQWLLSRNGQRTVYISPCYSVPLIDPFERREGVAEGEALPKIDRWTLIHRNGTIGAGLILTEHGWKKLAQPLVDEMNEQPGPAPDEGRAETCWFYDGLNPMMME